MEEHSSEIRGKRDKLYTYGYWLILLLVFCLGIFLNSLSHRVPLFQGTTDYQESSWSFGIKGGLFYPTGYDQKREFRPGQTYVLSTYLQYDGEGDQYPSALISSGSLEIEVFLDNHLVFSHTAQDKPIPTIQSVGYTIFPVNLGPHPQGRVFRMELRNPLNHTVEANFPHVSFGDHATQIRQLFLASLPSMMISAAITFAVVILIMLGNTVDGTQWTYVYFSAFAILIVFYRAMQDLFLLYMWGNPFMAVLFEYFSIVACPIPLLMSYRYRMKPYCMRCFDILIGISMLNLVVQNILHFTGLVDVSDMLLATHLWLLVAAVGLVRIGMVARKASGRKIVYHKLIPILVGALLDLTCYYLPAFRARWSSYYKIGNFIGLGLLLSLLMMIWEARTARVKAYQENEKNRILRKLAYTDALTGVGNRAAFVQDVEEIADGKYMGQSTIVVSADLNGLKETNDGQGHPAGDRLIQTAAEVLENCFRPYGWVYRTGGDEFFSILMDITEEQWEYRMLDLEQKVREVNETSDLHLAIAIGHAPLEGTDIKSCIELADQRMYEDKKQYHEKLHAQAR